MCGKTPKTPQVVQRDPIAEQRQAEAEAQLKANSDTAARKRRRVASGGGGSLLQPLNAQRQAPAKSLLAQAVPGG